jgi:hypothetical protein
MMKLKRTLKMNRVFIIIALAVALTGCGGNKNSSRRVAIANAGSSVLYLDDIPPHIMAGSSDTDSISTIKNYANKWAKKQLLLQKAEENLSPALKEEIDRQLEETRSDLVIYQYQRQMMLERMDTVVADSELESYYAQNQMSFLLSTSIVKALFIKLPFETPNIFRIKQLARSNDQADLQQLETICYQFADKFDDFSEEWVPLDRISVELPEDIENEDSFLKRTKFYESTDSSYYYLISIRDYRLRSTTAPFEYVKDDIKRMIWNNRRIEFIQELENGIYNDALKENKFRVF